MVSYLGNNLTSEINKESLSRILKQLKENNLGDIFANSWFLKLLVSANFVKIIKRYLVYSF